MHRPKQRIDSHTEIDTVSKIHKMARRGIQLGAANCHSIVLHDIVYMCIHVCELAFRNPGRETWGRSGKRKRNCKKNSGGKGKGV